MHATTDTMYGQDRSGLLEGTTERSLFQTQLNEPKLFAHPPMAMKSIHAKFE
jgi:hypothetical protein